MTKAEPTRRTLRGRTRAPQPALPLAPERRRFRTRLLAWYRRHGRDLPWRSTDDPYHILVSEMMLQQTQVDRVLPEVLRVAREVPLAGHASRGPGGRRDERVAPTWLQHPPARLQSIAREAVSKFGGQLPSDEETLLSFKGIGRYTAGAIRSFAFGARAAILDTNVARVLFRVFIADGDPKSHAMKARLWRHLRDARAAASRVRLQPGTHGSRRDRVHGPEAQVPCMPVGSHVPVGRTDVSRAPVVVAAAVIEQDGRFLLTRRLEGTHLAGRWEFPGGKCEPGETHAEALARELEEELAVPVAVGQRILVTTHAYDERTVELHFYETRLLGTPTPQLGQPMRWASREELASTRLPGGRRGSSSRCSRANDCGQLICSVAAALFSAPSAVHKRARPPPTGMAGGQRLRERSDSRHSPAIPAPQLAIVVMPPDAPPAGSAIAAARQGGANGKPVTTAGVPAGRIVTPVPSAAKSRWT